MEASTSENESSLPFCVLSLCRPPVASVPNSLLKLIHTSVVYVASSSYKISIRRHSKAWAVGLTRRIESIALSASSREMEAPLTL